MPALEELMLTEDFPPPEHGTLPALDAEQDTEADDDAAPDSVRATRRTAVSPGAPLTWAEVRGDLQPYPRRGMVLQVGPRAGTVWAVPAEPRPGEGYAVLVHDITGKKPAGARRVVGAPTDFWSTEEWQNPLGLLPRAFQRRDRVFKRDGSVDHEALSLHTWDPQCKCTPIVLHGQRVEFGLGEVADTVYVYGGRFLHPWSIRPADPTSYTETAGTRYVQLGRCFATRPDHGQCVPILPDEVSASP